LSYGSRVLFKDVSIKFLPGNTYGLIGANGAGKSTFLKILSGEIEADHGEVAISPGERIAVLKQNQFEFDDVEVLKTVLMGNKPLFDVVQEKDALYAKPDFSEEDGIRASELEAKFGDLGGWDVESQAGEMLDALGISTPLLSKKMKELEAGQKVRVLLAQALLGNPDILLLDESTNNLDMKSIMWLEEFLCEFKNTVIVVSHDRHFLDKVSTHMADIDFSKITIYAGNYSFWYESSQLALKQRYDRNKKAEDKVKELKAFIERFSANASKSKQATSRKKSLAKINLEEIKPSSRRYPHIVFHQEREAGKDLLSITGLQGVDSEGKEHFKNLDLIITKGEKVAFVGDDTQAATLLFEILVGEREPTAGSFAWGVTTTQGYFPKDHERFFESDLPIMEWLRQFVTNEDEMDEEFLRGFLGKMLFTGEEVYKKTSVLSGGEKVRCMLAKMMMQRANVLILNEPTNHLDIESITALNNGLIEYPGTVLFISQDRQTVDSISTRTVGLSKNGLIDHQISYTEHMDSPML
jgi:ATPase subunit of ABC transporter with duplicated ATPase domains